MILEQKKKLIIEDNTGPEILPEEITAAINQMKDGKAPGLDQIPTELLKLLNEEQIKTISKIFNHI